MKRSVSRKGEYSLRYSSAREERVNVLKRRRVVKSRRIEGGRIRGEVSEHTLDGEGRRDWGVEVVKSGEGEGLSKEALRGLAREGNRLSSRYPGRVRVSTDKGRRQLEECVKRGRGGKIARVRTFGKGLGGQRSTYSVGKR
jgi:hypothetical protein